MFITELPFALWTQDRLDADVHLLITRLGTASGGGEYTLTLIGQRRFAARVDTLAFGELMVVGTRVPIVADAFGGADGVLGGEGMMDKRIQIEFRKDRINIARSKRAPAPPGYSVVPFKHSQYQAT